MFSLKQIEGDKVLSMSHVLISIRMKTNINTFYTVTSSIQTIKEKKNMHMKGSWYDSKQWL